MIDRTFCWHPDAMLVAADGSAATRPGLSENGTGLALIPDRDGTGALLEVFAAIGAGRPFRLLNGREHADTGRADCGADPMMFQCESGGTLGRPKVIERSHRSWVESFAIARSGWHRGPAEIVALPGRLGHSLTLYGALEALHLGARLHLLGELGASRMVGRMAEIAATLVYATPVQLRLMAAGKGQAPSVRRVMSGGGTLDPATRAATARTFPDADIVEFFGASETSFIAITDRATPEGSVGRAYPGVTIEIRDPSGRVVGSGETGTIWVASPYLFDGYAGGAPHGTRREGRFLTIGDRGHLDAAGYLYFHGRAGRIVTIADQTVRLDEVEALIRRQAGVAEAAVLAVSDALRGNRLVAFVHRSGEAMPATIRAACRARFGPLATPREVRVVEDWPVLGSGKTDLAALEKLARETAAR